MFSHSRAVLLTLALSSLTLPAFAQPAPATPEKPKTDATRVIDTRAQFFSQLNTKLTALGLQPAEIIAVRQFIEDQEPDRLLIRKAAYQLSLAQSRNLSDEEFAPFLDDYMKLTNSFRLKQIKALEDLKPKIKWNERPKLQAFLTFQGIFGDALAISASVNDLWMNNSQFRFSLDREMTMPTRVATNAGN